MFDSDEEESGPQAIEALDFVFNTNDLLRTQQTTVRNWLSDDLDAWVFSREEFHSEQVDHDRLLPANLSDLSSSYVSPLYFCFLISFFQNIII